jgi:hypothetical protein
MTDDEWMTISMLLDKGFKWREPFGVAHATTYRVLLDGYDAEQIAGGLRKLIARGQVFGPTPGELVALINEDPSRPTFIEAYRLIYGKGGILRARPTVSTWPDNAAKERDYDLAARERAAAMHPLVAAFVERYGISRLRLLEVDHDDYGELNRKDLEAHWDRFCEAVQDRRVAAIAAPRRGEGLAKLDPLSALGVRSPAAELEPGGDR